MAGPPLGPVITKPPDAFGQAPRSAARRPRRIGVRTDAAARMPARQAETAAELRATDADDGAGSLDSLELFMRKARVHPLLTAAEEIELAKKIERGDLAAKERMINANLRLGRIAGTALSGPRPADGGPGPGGNAWPDPRGREVRLAARASSSRHTARCGSGRRFSADSRTMAGRSGCRSMSRSAR